MKVQQDRGLRHQGRRREMVSAKEGEKPDWATFDEDDEPEPETPTANGEACDRGAVRLCIR